MTRARKAPAAPSETAVLASFKPVSTGPRSRLSVSLIQWRDTPPRLELRYEVLSVRGWYVTPRRIGLPVAALAGLKRSLEDAGEELRTRRNEGWRERYGVTPEED